MHSTRVISKKKLNFEVKNHFASLKKDKISGSNSSLREVAKFLKRQLDHFRNNLGLLKVQKSGFQEVNHCRENTVLMYSNNFSMVKIYYLYTKQPSSANGSLTDGFSNVPNVFPRSFTHRLTIFCDTPAILFNIYV